MRLVFGCGVFAVMSVALQAAPAWQAGPGFRSAQLAVPASGKSGFTQLPPTETGITFTNHLANASVAENQIRLIGSGVALGDVDGDGRNMRRQRAS